MDNTKNNTPELTLGEKRVRTSFNVSASSEVDTIKQDTAKLIDRVKSLEGNGTISGEKARLISLAMTAYEEAAMWAVKAVTIE